MSGRGRGGGTAAKQILCRRYRLGEDLEIGQTHTNHDLAIVAEFANEADYHRYATSDEHLSAVGLLKPHFRRADIPRTGRGDAVAATWKLRGDRHDVGILSDRRARLRYMAVRNAVQARLSERAKPQRSFETHPQALFAFAAGVALTLWLRPRK